MQILKKFPLFLVLTLLFTGCYTTLKMSKSGGNTYKTKKSVYSRHLGGHFHCHYERYYVTERYGGRTVRLPRYKKYCFDTVQDYERYYYDLGYNTRSGWHLSFYYNHSYSRYYNNYNDYYYSRHHYDHYHTDKDYDRGRDYRPRGGTIGRSPTRDDSGDRGVKRSDKSSSENRGRNRSRSRENSDENEGRGGRERERGSGNN